MNLGEIKAFLGEKPTRANPNEGIQQQLREMGLKQAAQGSGREVTFSQSILSSQTTVGLRVYNNALNSSLTINENKANLPKPDQQAKSLFDFEEVAKNVLKFVGGAIKHAAAKGADQEALTSMFEQARSGVLQGIKLAEKDLAGLMNEEIENGIEQSKSLIDDGIKRLEDKIFGREDAPEAKGAVINESVSYVKNDSGELNIKTRDGDEVTFKFEDLQQFEFNRLQLIEQNLQPVNPPEDDKIDKYVGNTIQSVEQPEADDAKTAEEAEVAPAADDGNETPNQPVTNQAAVVENYQFYEKSGLSFSLKGELDDEELRAISDLVGDANDLANDFFSGDIESAFEKALAVGFNEQELTGFALQLTRQEQLEVVQTYESVSHYNEKSPESLDATKAVKPISQYLEKMLSVFEQSQQKLQNSDSYEEIINGIVNQIDNIDTKDLLSAINSFHEFNSRLLRSLPNNLQDTQ